jgi:glycosyltransferase involved in cell wall biosynthesis
MANDLRPSLINYATYPPDVPVGEMKILLANYRYFVSGGPERYMFNITDALTEHGHEVVPFSITYSRNQPTAYSRYFAKPLGGSDEVYFRQHKLTLRTLWATLSRLFYAKDVYRAVALLANDTQPHVAYILHYLRKLSPSLLAGLRQSRVPIIVRLSDYAMICPQAHCLRNEKPCELCAGGNLLPSIAYRCVQGSLPASLLNAAATTYHRATHCFDLVDTFVVTTRFMHRKMLDAGYAEARLCHIPTFVDSKVFHPAADAMNRDYLAYAGRLEAIKGVHVLIDAFSLLCARRPGVALTLRIAGEGNAEYVAQLKQRVQHLNLNDSVVFLGEQSVDGLVKLLNRALVSVVPSLWYENLPNAILESYACGTPVVASRIGSLPECVDEGRTGYLFEPADAEDLAERLGYCYDHPEEMADMGRHAREVAETVYSKERHLETLTRLLLELAHERK